MAFELYFSVGKTAIELAALAAVIVFTAASGVYIAECLMDEEEAKEELEPEAI